MTSIAENPPEHVNFVVEKNRVLKLQNTARFFEELRTREPITSIYYPAPGFDDSLSTVFSPTEIIYIDREPRFDNVTQGDFREIKLPPNSVDAVFVQDIHEKPEDIVEFLRALKKNGLLIYSLYGCGVEKMGSRSFDSLKGITVLNEEYILKDWKIFFRTFRKN